MKSYLIAVLIVSVLVLGLLIGCAPPTEVTKAPEDVIPLAVPDFTLVEKKERIEGFEGEQYSASSLFIPREGSRFQNKVTEVHISVHLVKDETTATSIFEMWTQDATKIKVKGVDTLLVYDEEGSRKHPYVRCGKIHTIQQRGRLIIYSTSFSPIDIEGWLMDAPTLEFHREALTDAAVQCLEAVRL